MEGLRGCVGEWYAAETMFLRMRPTRADKPDGYLLGSYRIATAPEATRDTSCPVSKIASIGPEVQTQILRLTTPKLKSVWGPVRSG